ncbi:MAG: translation initiation factor IF-2 subunit alpha [Nitrososphaerales archaeon]
MSELNELPEEGELVLATVTKVTPYAAYVSLDEYNGMSGFLHISEISTGWVRNIEKVIKERQKLVLKVIRINPIRREVDLSLKQVTEDEKRRKLLEIKRQEKARGIVETVCKKLNLNEEKKMSYINLLSEEFGSLFDALENLVKKGRKAFEKLNLPEDFVFSLEEVAKGKVVPEVRVRGIMKIVCPLPNGIEVIKRALDSAQQIKANDISVKISYMGAPRYQIVVGASNYKIAEKTLNSIINKIRETLVKNNATFEFIPEK